MIDVIISGTLLGLIYALGAAGFTLLFGVSGVLNFAHGALLVAAAYVAWWVSGYLTNPYFAWPAQFFFPLIIIELLALGIWQFIVKPIMKVPSITLKKREGLILAATLVGSEVLEEVISLSFGFDPIRTPPLANGTVSFLGVLLVKSRIYVGILAAVLLIALSLFLNKSRIGLNIRAAAMSREGLAICGGSPARAELFTWLLYGLITCIAGVLLGTFQGLSRDSSLPLSINAFAVVVLGGLGSVGGAAVAALVLGIAETATIYWISPYFAAFPALIIMILVLIMRPSGLFGRKMRTY